MSKDSSHFTVTVGPSKADVVGRTGRAIQIAIDALAFRGGGTVCVLPGEYTLTDAVRLRRNIRLTGNREKTLLRRAPLIWSPLAVDADTSQEEITPVNPSPFEPGMGVCLWDEKGWVHSKDPLVIHRIENGVLYLNTRIEADRYATAGGRVVNFFPMISADGIEGASVDGFTVDASAEDPDKILTEGISTTAVRFFRSRNCAVRNVKVTGSPGDGIGFTHGSVGGAIEDCETAHNGVFGIHPGGHSPSIVIRHCDVHHNGWDGLYICWGVRNSVIEDNHIHHNARIGISIGHKDSDNQITRNRIRENGMYGMFFREETEANGAHRNTVSGNLIENNGSRLTPEDAPVAFKRIGGALAHVGIGVRIMGSTHDLAFTENAIRDTHAADRATQRHAFHLGPGVSRVTIEGNTVEGHPDKPIVDVSGASDHRIQEGTALSAH